MTEKQLKQEFLDMWMPRRLGEISTMPQHLNALIERVIEERMRNMYPKEFIEWAVENCRCEADGLWFYDWDEKAEQYKKCLTTDELFNYWKENEK